MEESKSLRLAREFLGKKIEVKINRPLGSRHPKHDFLYEVNYGFIPHTKAPDGGEIDAYYLGVDEPLDKARGKCVAIVHRLKDDDDKLVVVPREAEGITDKEILEAVHFQEQWFEHEILRK
jgi:inorganic pyrophosphatase